MDLISQVIDEAKEAAAAEVVAEVAPLVDSLIEDVERTIRALATASAPKPQVKWLRQVLTDLQMSSPAAGTATPENATMMQAFEWYVPADHQHWKRLTRALPQLKAWGIDNLWIPPGCKAGSSQSNGYDIYDLYDLGEFDQKDRKSVV